MINIGDRRFFEERNKKGRGKDVPVDDLLPRQGDRQTAIRHFIRLVQTQLRHIVQTRHE